MVKYLKGFRFESGRLCVYVCVHTQRAFMIQRMWVQAWFQTLWLWPLCVELHGWVRGVGLVCTP